MESKIKSSFIPKKPVASVATPQRTSYKSSGLDLATLVGVIAIVIAGVLSAGVFSYKELAIADNKSKKDSLESITKSFDPKLIKKLTQISTRIQVAGTILDNHTAPSVFLQALEHDTLTGVQFLDFKYKYSTTQDPEFTLKGKAASVNSVALQSSRFGESTLIKNSIFSDIDLVRDGVTFNVTGNIDLDSIRYTSIVSLLGQAESFDTTPLDTASATLDTEQIDSGEFGQFGNFE